MTVLMFKNIPESKLKSSLGMMIIIWCCFIINMNNNYSKKNRSSFVKHFPKESYKVLYIIKKSINKIENKIIMTHTNKKQRT